jgi:hypothetical protein
VLDSLAWHLVVYATMLNIQLTKVPSFSPGGLIRNGEAKAKSNLPKSLCMLHKTGFDSIVMAATTAVSHHIGNQAKKKKKGKN